MSPHAMSPHGRALLAFWQGDAEATLTTRREDGFEFAIPVSHFFRTPQHFTPLEQLALDRCRGQVLDVGAGTGLHALALQDRGLSVTAIDVAPEAVEVMAARGVRDARRADVLTFEGGPYDTLLLLGHGVGMAGSLHGLGRLLDQAGRLLRPGGHLLLDSVDVRATDDPVHTAYHDTCRQEGRYVGEVRMQLAFGDVTGPMIGWLHVDPETLAAAAGAAGWATELLLDAGHGEYLAALTLAGAA